MNKYSLIIFLGILGLFGGIIYANQGNTIIKSEADLMPSGSVDANKLEFISIAPQNPQSNANPGQRQAQVSVEPTWGVEEGVKASYSAILKTSKGNITLKLDGKGAPKTVRNFLNKVKSDFYTNLIFHRVEDWVIQGGDPKGNGTGGGVMLTEINNNTFVPGSLGAARGGDIRISNDSQFFITKTEAPWLNQQYTNFGEVTDGMDIVNKIQKGDKILGVEIEDN